jgi:hypothetical protein
VDARAIVGALGWLETIEAKGTAVGFVAKRVTVILGVDVVAATVTEPLTVAEGTFPEIDDEGVPLEVDTALEETARG